LDRAAFSSGLWARSLAINLLALAACRFLLNNFEIHGVWAYALAAVGIELPTLLWWLTIQLWQAKAFSDSVADASYFGRLAWVALLVALTFVVPLALATSVPGLLVAEWISPLTINGFWTYVAACAITTALTIALRQSRPLKFMLGFLTREAREGTSQPVETN
jgi:hypothetical protein